MRFFITAFKKSPSLGKGRELGADMSSSFRGNPALRGGEDVMIENQFRNQILKSKQAGFTLIELILYVTLVSIFLTAAILFAWNIIYGREKSFQQSIVDQSARIALAKISYEIRRAGDIQSLSANQLVLESEGSTTTIEKSGSELLITSNGMGPYSLASNQVAVTNLAFTNLSSVDNSSKIISIELTLRQAQDDVPNQFIGETTIIESVELKGQFNQSRKVLVDLGGVGLTAGASLEGITLENLGLGPVTLDKMSVSWMPAVGGENVTEVQIGGGVVEWSGSQPTGSILDLNDFTLDPTDGTVLVDHITFDSDMSGADLNLELVMLDGSIVKIHLELQSDGATPTLTPTPTETPTPTNTPSASSCSEYCVGLGYLGGACRKNSNQCSQNGETNEAGGNQFCTQQPNNTCCCQP